MWDTSITTQKMLSREICGQLRHEWQRVWRQCCDTACADCRPIKFKKRKHSLLLSCLLCPSLPLRRCVGRPKHDMMSGIDILMTLCSGQWIEISCQAIAVYVYPLRALLLQVSQNNLEMRRMKRSLARQSALGAMFRLNLSVSQALFFLPHLRSLGQFKAHLIPSLPRWFSILEQIPSDFDKLPITCGGFFVHWWEYSRNDISVRLLFRYNGVVSPAETMSYSSQVLWPPNGNSMYEVYIIVQWHALPNGENWYL